MVVTDIARSASFCRLRDDLSITRKLSGSGVKRDCSSQLAIHVVNDFTDAMSQSSGQNLTSQTISGRLILFTANSVMAGPTRC